MSLMLKLPAPITKGGAGSGNFGHAGRPGSRGGSVSSSVGTAQLADWYRPPTLDKGLVAKLGSEGKGDTYVMAGELGLESGLRAFDRVNRRWTQGADIESKPEIVGWLRAGTGVRELTLYDAWSSGDSELGFEVWLETPQTFYRGGGRSPQFMSFAPSLEVAKDASKAARFFSVSVKPSGLLGSGMTGAGEVYIETEAIEGISYKGGAGSGNFGHAGRPGSRGGSASVAGGTFRAISTEEGARAWAGQHLSDWRAGLSGSQIDTLEEYTSEDYMVLNDHLRFGSAEDPVLTTMADKISSSMTPLSENIVVHRQIDPDVVDAIREGGIGGGFSDKAFVSTALVLDSFKQTDMFIDEPDSLIRIELPKGTRVAYLGNIGSTTGITYIPEETELLLDRGQQFEVRSVGNVPTLRVVP